MQIFTHCDTFATQARYMIIPVVTFFTPPELPNFARRTVYYVQKVERLVNAQPHFSPFCRVCLTPFTAAYSGLIMGIFIAYNTCDGCFGLCGDF